MLPNGTSILIIENSWPRLATIENGKLTELQPRGLAFRGTMYIVPQAYANLSLNHLKNLALTNQLEPTPPIEFSRRIW